MRYPDAWELRIKDFEEAWQRGQMPEIAAYLSSLRAAASDRDLCRALLVELIAIDLEYRWRASVAEIETGSPRQLEDYLRLFPELGRIDQTPLELIGEEYRVRQRWGDRMSLESYVRRFSGHSGEIRKLLSRIDRELLLELQESFRVPTVGKRANRARKKMTAGVDPRAPLTDSDFLLERHLGTGGIGKVYRALQRSLERQVAVKFLKKHYLDDPDVVTHFLAEAKHIAKLRHRGIVAVHGVGQTLRGGYFIVMDLIEGKDLSKVIGGGLPATGDAVRWVAEAAAVLEHAHSRG